MVSILFTPKDDNQTLQNFVDTVNPGGPGWSNFVSKLDSKPWLVPNGILCMLLGCIAVYSILLGTGQLIYGNINIALVKIAISVVSSYILFKIWR